MGVCGIWKIDGEYMEHIHGNTMMLNISMIYGILRIDKNRSSAYRRNGGGI